MIKPIYLLGTKELRGTTKPVTSDSPRVQALIVDMMETMQGAKGIGLAAPQIGRNDRIFVIDLSNMEKDIWEEGQEIPPQPMVFINPVIVDESDEGGEFEEGCLSIPDIHEAVARSDNIRLQYLDMNYQAHEGTFDGFLARVIQHEYDHLEGVLFLDHLSAFKRRLLKRKLSDIRNGITDVDYPVYSLKTGIVNPSLDLS